MSSDQSRRRERSKDARRDREMMSIDRNADEALRSLVRVLAREAARELFANSRTRLHDDDTPEDQR